MAEETEEFKDRELSDFFKLLHQTLEEAPEEGIWFPDTLEQVIDTFLRLDFQTHCDQHKEGGCPTDDKVHLLTTFAARCFRTGIVVGARAGHMPIDLNREPVEPMNDEEWVEEQALIEEQKAFAEGKLAEFQEKVNEAFKLLGQEPPDVENGPVVARAAVKGVPKENVEKAAEILRGLGLPVFLEAPTPNTGMYL